MRTLLALSLFAFAQNSFAGGAVVAGGKTHTAILVYENYLTQWSVDQVHAEITRLFETREQPQILGYREVTDENGETVMCAAFASSIVGKAAQVNLEAIAKQGGMPDAVRSVGGCTFFDGKK